MRVTDFFCGMGGSSTGLTGAGFEVTLAANHWDRAIETHAANHPDTEHLCADLTGVDLRYLPRTEALWASPICTEVSPAGGRRKKGHQLDLFEDYGHVPSEAFERTRATFWEVIRATEVHRYRVIMVENVVEAAQWELFDVWLDGMDTLGYSHQFVSVSAAHIGDDTNAHAPQWRDRLYIVFHQRGMRAPDLEPRPWAWCDKCGDNVQSVQWWKRDGRRIGKFNAQYFYVCPVGNHGRVEPYIMPASAAIDWTDIGTRIGDRPRPLSAATMRRIQLGLDRFVNREFVVPVDRPFQTFTTGRHHGLTIPGTFVSQHHGGYANPDRMNSAADSEPLPTMTAQGSRSLVIPFRRGSKPYPADSDALSTMATRDQHGIMQPAVEVEDCYFRMIRPREAANAQRFPREYVIHGNRGEQQMQAGNAVAVNVAQWIGGRVAEVLGG